jgi:nucleotide-binding universal stress UspA family protein
VHIFIATDGSLNMDKTVELVKRLYEPDDMVTIFTAIEFPRSFLQNYAAASGAADIAAIADAAGSQLASGSKAAEHLMGTPERAADPQQMGTKNYFLSVAEKCCGPLKAALGDSGITAAVLWARTENQTARVIIAEADVKKADILILGSHGQGGFEGPLGSTVTKVVRRAKKPVLLVR